MRLRRIVSQVGGGRVVRLFQEFFEFFYSALEWWALNAINFDESKSHTGL